MSQFTKSFKVSLLVTSLFMGVFTSTTEAMAQREVGNGGSLCQSEFITAGKFFYYGMENMDNLPISIDMKKFKEKVDSATVIIKPNLQLKDSLVDAINYPQQNRIEVSKNWCQSKSQKKYKIVLHEYLGLMDSNLDQNYESSESIFGKLTSEYGTSHFQKNINFFGAGDQKLGLKNCREAVLQATKTKQISVVEYLINSCPHKELLFAQTIEAENHYNGKDQIPLAMWVAIQSLEFSKLMFKYNLISINAHSLPSQFTPLTWAIIKKRRDIAQYFIEAGADVNPRYEITNNSLIQFTARRGMPETVLLMIKYGANVNAPNAEGYTALMSSIGEEYANIKIPPSSKKSFAQHLLEAGADPNMQSIWGKTALMMAAAQPFNEDLLHLIKAGADINLQDKRGTTALMIAAAKAEYENALYLLEAGADINLQEEHGYTTLMITKTLLARESDLNSETAKKLEKMIELLEKYGATDSNTQIYTAALVAAVWAGDHKAVIRLLRTPDANIQYASMALLIAEARLREASILMSEEDFEGLRKIIEFIRKSKEPYKK